ncbi:hypothetical protein GCM10009647_079780 [Streptomyces sanglieri]
MDRRELLQVAIGTLALTQVPIAFAQDNDEFNVVDIMFVRMMILHHEGAVQMAELIPVRTDREELLDLRTEVIKEQEAEIDLMCELLNDAGVAGCDEVGT